MTFKTILLSVIFYCMMLACTFASTAQNPFGSNRIFKIFPLHYLSSESVKTLILKNKSQLIGPEGQAFYDPQTNQLFIGTKANNLKSVTQFIAAIDKPSPQILINAEIINMDTNGLRQLGLSLHSTTIKSKNGLTMDVPNTLSQGLSIPILQVGHHTLFNLKLQALEEEGHAHVVSHPKVLIMNHHTAIIEAGEEIPYQQATSSGATSIAFKKAVLRLQVTPNILSQHQLLLKLIINQDKVSPLVVNGVPAIGTQQLQTTAVVQDQHTISLGGIMENTASTTETRTPIISRIPVLGSLFRQHERRNHRKVLLILLTPKIIQ